MVNSGIFEFNQVPLPEFTILSPFSTADIPSHRSNFAAFLKTNEYGNRKENRSFP